MHTRLAGKLVLILEALSEIGHESLEGTVSLPAAHLPAPASWAREAAGPLEI